VILGARTSRPHSARSALKFSPASKLPAGMVNKMKRTLQTGSAIILGVAIGIFFAGCRRSPTTDETPDTSTYRPESTPATQFERDLKFIRDGHFTRIWVFSRKDDKEFTREDSDALRANAPRVVDWVTTDANKKVIGGSNFDLEPAQMAALQKRFKVEDYSGK
jgi:hypothetical protein